VLDGLAFFTDGIDDVRGVCDGPRAVRLGAARELGTAERECTTDAAAVGGATAAMLVCSAGRGSWAGALGRAEDASPFARSAAAGCGSAASPPILAVSAGADCEIVASFPVFAVSGAAGALLESSLASFGAVIESLVCSLGSAFSGFAAATRCALGKASTD